MTAKIVTVASCVASVVLVHSAIAEDFQLPPEVTPQLRAACESDVRRLCIGTNPTVEKVKSCVAAKFSQLGNRCKIQIAMAGLKP
jgi:Cysteine rich repeat